MFKQKDLQLMIMLLLGCSGYLHRASTAGPSGRGGWVLWACHADELHLLLLFCTEVLVGTWQSIWILVGFVQMEVFSLFDLCPEREIRVWMSKGLRILRSGAISQPLFQFVVCLGYILLPPTCTKTIKNPPHALCTSEWISAVGAVSTNTRMGSDASRIPPSCTRFPHPPTS